MRLINLEEGYPSLIEAMAIVKSTLDGSKNSKKHIYVFIHGYGSSGSGGRIRSALRRYLKALMKEGKIKTFVEGEHFEMFNADARALKDKDNSLLEFYGKFNEGITIVEA